MASSFTASQTKESLKWREWDSFGLKQQLGVVPSFEFEPKAA
jgi:hypothetical protein